MMARDLERGNAALAGEPVERDAAELALPDQPDGAIERHLPPLRAQRHGIAPAGTAGVLPG
jgi:hypothetical protein